MYCSNCGNKKENNEKFCSECGTKYPEQIQVIEEPKKKNKALIITLIAIPSVIALVLLLLVGYILLDGILYCSSPCYPSTRDQCVYDE